MKPHLRAVLYRQELIVFVRYLIYIYVANKDFSELLNILEKTQLNRINAKMEQNNNYNSYCCPRSVGLRCWETPFRWGYKSKDQIFQKM